MFFGGFAPPCANEAEIHVNLDLFFLGLVVAVLAPPRTNLTKIHANLGWTHAETIYLINSWDIQTAYTGSKKIVFERMTSNKTCDQSDL